MKTLATTLAISTIVFLSGCGGTPTVLDRAPVSPPATTPVPPTPVTSNIDGNWQFSATSNTPGALPFSIGGSISQSDAAINGALHIDGSNCFDRLITRGLSGNVTADTAALVITGMDGQVVAFTGRFSNTALIGMYTFTGTYKINGGCGDGDEGTVTGINIPPIANQLSGTFIDNSARHIFHVTGNIAQSNSASPEGSYAITGTAPSTFDTACFATGTIRPGTFPSGSFILGTSVDFEFDTSNGTLTFLGTLNRDKTEIDGNYTVAGGACDQTGTAALLVSSSGNSSWDY